ncbi:hypothetical protein POM88_008340 [Heracleum sosnowskyi]|uniref:Uncharacterized protein n=1 Tax=Heracleum sosnowskyi TaxID=360622 RepID=A0AAD8N766_9APIA|nr:hypothetical protein POM88_008340 [Heracleum sosnowskyi]
MDCLPQVADVAAEKNFYFRMTDRYTQYICDTLSAYHEPNENHVPSLLGTATSNLSPVHGNNLGNAYQYPVCLSSLTFRHVSSNSHIQHAQLHVFFVFLHGIRYGKVGDETLEEKLNSMHETKLGFPCGLVDHALNMEIFVLNVQRPEIRYWRKLNR